MYGEAIVDTYSQSFLCMPHRFPRCRQIKEHLSDTVSLLSVGKRSLSLTGIGGVLDGEAISTHIAMCECDVIHAVPSKILLRLRCAGFMKFIGVQPPSGANCARGRVRE
jgi:hypothetical protein